MNADSLRPWRPSDTPTLADLWVRSWQETLPSIDFSARRGWLVAFLDGDGAANRVTIVAHDRIGVLAGFVTIEPAQACVHQHAYLHQLVVDPSAKGRGIAAALLDAAKAAAPSGMTLDVNQANARAVRFYEREGFVRENAGRNAGSGLATWRLRWIAAL